MPKGVAAVRPEKVAAVEGIADRFNRANLAVVADYRGLTVAQTREVRRQLQAVGAEMRIAKNTLARLAVKGTDGEAVLPILEGPTAVVFAYGDEVQSARALMDVIRLQRLGMQIKGALLGTRLLSGEEVTRLAELPSKEVLQATLVGTIGGPLAALVGTLNGALQQLVGVLDARGEQLSGAAA